MNYGERTSKIFGIGLSRTGTTSLTEALTILGYRARHFPQSHLTFWGSVEINQIELKKFDAFTDTPVALNFQKLDQMFPGSKFILTLREITAWLESCRRYQWNQTGRLERKLRLALYGCTEFNPELFRNAYQRHTQTVLQYFRNRAGDLLIIDITKGDGWGQLCPFLGTAKPAVAFPCKNQNR